MIWLLMGIMVLAALLYVTQPLYTKRPLPAIQGSEIEDYNKKIADIEAQIAQGGENASALENTKVQLQRQVLLSQEHGIAKDAGPSSVLLSSLFIGTAFAAVGLYAAVGRPELTHPPAPQSLNARQDASTVDPSMSLTDIVVRLEQKLEQDDKNVIGWMMYARSLMSLGRYEDAVVAYERAITLTDNNPKIIEELESAKVFIKAKTRPGPSEEDMKNAAAMSKDERTAMIEGMVEGLAQKLEDNPNDIQGWIRLLNVRRVLGQEEQIRADIESMKVAFKDKPETIASILAAAGRSEN